MLRGREDEERVEGCEGDVVGIVCVCVSVCLSVCL